MTLQEILAGDIGSKDSDRGCSLKHPSPPTEPRSPSPLNAPESVHSVTELGSEKIFNRLD